MHPGAYNPWFGQIEDPYQWALYGDNFPSSSRGGRRLVKKHVDAATENALCRRSRRRLRNLQDNCTARITFDRTEHVLYIEGNNDEINEVYRQLESLYGERKAVPTEVWCELMRTRTEEDVGKSLLKQLQEQSGCRIHIERGNQEVRLFGTFDEREQAERLIDELCERCKQASVPIEETTLDKEVLEDISSKGNVTLSVQESEVIVMGLSRFVDAAVAALKSSRTSERSRLDGPCSLPFRQADVPSAVPEAPIGSSSLPLASLQPAHVPLHGPLLTFLPPGPTAGTSSVGLTGGLPPPGYGASPAFIHPTLMDERPPPGGLPSSFASAAALSRPSPPAPTSPAAVQPPIMKAPEPQSILQPPPSVAQALPQTVQIGRRHQRVRRKTSPSERNFITRQVTTAVWCELMRTRMEKEEAKSHLVRLEKSSGTRIHIERSEQEVRIFGPDENIAVAKRLLDRMENDCAEDSIDLEEYQLTSAAEEDFGALADELKVTLHRTESTIRVFGFREAVDEAIHRLQTWSGSPRGSDANHIDPLGSQLGSLGLGSAAEASAALAQLHPLLASPSAYQAGQALLNPSLSAPNPWAYSQAFMLTQMCPALGMQNPCHSAGSPVCPAPLRPPVQGVS